MKCPGQDRRYWTEDAVFEVPCPKCGRAVEIFQDEGSCRCPECSHRFKNPRTDFGCAEWCAYAKECLGFAPQRASPANLGEGAIAGRLMQAVQEEFKEQQGRVTHSLTVFQHAKNLASKEGGDFRIVLAAALLLEVARNEPEAAEGPSKVRRILGALGLDEDMIQRVCLVVGECRADKLDSLESKIVSDSDRLAKMGKEDLAADSDQLETIIRDDLKTEAAKSRARSLFQD